jgi:hypothetical protein
MLFFAGLVLLPFENMKSAGGGKDVGGFSSLCACECGMCVCVCVYIYICMYECMYVCICK